jgi:hypothetical protein
MVEIAPSFRNGCCGLLMRQKWGKFGRWGMGEKIDSGKINDLPVVIWQFGDLLYSA